MPSTYSVPAPQMPDTSYSAYLDMYRKKYPNDATAGLRGVFGSIFGGYSNWANSELAKYQNSYNQWQQEYANWYNSPANQASLYDEGGFNRNLITSGATGSSSMSPIDAQVPKVTDVGQNAFSSFASLLSLATGIVNLQGKSLDNQFKLESLPSRLDLSKLSADNMFTRYQSSLQNVYKNDWLLGTQLTPNSMDIAGVGSSPFAQRYQSELSGIQIMNSLRQSQITLQSLSADKQKFLNENMLSLQKDLLEGRLKLQDVDVNFREFEKKLGLAKGVLSPLLDLLKMVFPVTRFIPSGPSGGFSYPSSTTFTY